MTVEQDTTQRYGTNGAEPSIDELTCAARDIERQAEVMQEARPQLDTFREQYGAGSRAYTTVFETATGDVAKARSRLAQLRGDIDCKVSEKDRAGLNARWAEVRGEVEGCLPEPGCRTEDCNPDASVDEDVQQADLVGRIQALRQEAVERAAYFERLVAEQADLPARASAAAQAVDQLATDLRVEPQDDGSRPDQQRLRNAGLYARAVVADWQLGAVIDRYFGTVDAYTTCLRTSLSCLLRVWQAIATLEGAAAKRACREEQAAASCTTLLGDPAAEVVTRWRRHPDYRYAAEAGPEGPE